jgi:hypothetical protein
VRIHEGVNVTSVYNDGNIECTEGEILLRGYYFPWESKHIAYGSIVSVQRIRLTHLRGKWRIWGTANFKYWAPFDLSRPKKDVGFVLDLGRSVKPFITPSDPEKFGAVIRDRTNARFDESDTPQGPLV